MSKVYLLLEKWKRELALLKSVSNYKEIDPAGKAVSLAFMEQAIAELEEAIRE